MRRRPGPGPAPVVGLDHLVLTVTDLEATVAFYERLGMRREEFGDGRIALHFGAHKLNLHRAGAEFEPHARRPVPGSADLCLMIDGSLDAAARRLRDGGIPVELGPVERTGARGRSVRSTCAIRTAISSSSPSPREGKDAVAMVYARAVAKVFDGIDETSGEWIAAQPLFFVGTAPLAADGHVNLSPKGPSARCGSSTHAPWRTSTHRQRRRDDRAPARERPHRGDVVRVRRAAADRAPARARRGAPARRGGLRGAALGVRVLGPSIPAARRSIVRVEVTRIADSCGYGVPLMA